MKSNNFGRHAHCGHIRREIFHNRCTGTNHSACANSNTLPYTGTNPDPAMITNMDATGQMRARTYMHSFTQLTIMVNAATGI